VSPANSPLVVATPIRAPAQLSFLTGRAARNEAARTFASPSAKFIRTTSRVSALARPPLSIGALLHLTAILKIPVLSVLPLQSSSSHTLGSQSPVAPLRTSHPSGSRPCESSLQLVTPTPGRQCRPQKTLCSSPCPIPSIAHCDRTNQWLRLKRSNP